MAPVSVIFGAMAFFFSAFAEVLRQYDRRVVFAGLHAFHGLVGADERPAEPVVLLELADDLLARVEPPDQI